MKSISLLKKMGRTRNRLSCISQNVTESPTNRNRQAEQSPRRKTPDTGLIQLLPRYSAEPNENPKQFFREFENVAALTEWSEEQKGILLKTCLKNKARAFILSITEQDNENRYKILKQAILNRFEDTKSASEIHAEFNSIRQTPNISIRQLSDIIAEKTDAFLRIETASEETNKIKNQIRLAKFIEAVRPEIRREILKSDIKNFDEAVDIAIRLEKIFNEEEDINQVGIKPTTEVAELLKDLEISQLKEKLKECEKKIQTLQTPHITQKAHHIQTCEFCGKVNHSEKDCWFNTSNNRQSANQANNRVARRFPIICQICGRPNHSAQECWERHTSNERPQQNFRRNRNNFSRGNGNLNLHRGPRVNK